MRILLVQPAPFEDRRLGLENTVWCSEPVALTSVAAMVRDHEVMILDMRLEKASALAETLASWRPDVVGTTAMTTDAYQAASVMRLTRQVVPQALTIIGGHHCTLVPEFYHQPFVDVIVKGEGEEIFREILERWDALSPTERVPGALEGLAGAEVRRADGTFNFAGKRPWVRDLDALPAPARDLVQKYYGEYFFLAAQPMASIFTSRGCSFDCNFCAIWEFYDRRTRFLSAKVIADRMEACEEPFLFLLDDNFLTRTDRLERLVEELSSRGIKKHWMTQGRADFVANNPALMAKLAEVGMVGLLSGYETNDPDALAGLRKRSTLDANQKAAKILHDNGVISIGIFMVRPEFDRPDFQALYDYILDLKIAIPLVTILTPLPGTQQYTARRHELLTEDYRLFDLLHAVLPTRLPRDEFYQEYVRWKAVSHACRKQWWTREKLFQRPDFYAKLLRNVPGMVRKRLSYERIQFNPRSYLRDEEGIIDPSARWVAPAAEAAVVEAALRQQVAK